MDSSIVLAASNLLCLAASVLVVTVGRIPQLAFLLQYGKTLRQEPRPKSLDLYVPKRWFLHFYILSAILSGGCLLWVGVYYPYRLVHLVCILNLIQGTKRAYECCFVSKFSPTAKVHITHYIAGILVYFWVDVLPVLNFLQPNTKLSQIPNGTSYLVATILLAFSYDQYCNHKHLASLKKYTMPTKGLFEYITCAHYFDEVAIYVCHAVLQQTTSSYLVLLWTIVSLSASATESYKYYGKPNKAIIVPFIY